MTDVTKDILVKLEIATRIALFIFTVTIGMFVLLAGTRAAFAASLKSEAVITGDYIRLGDVFDNVKNAEYILGPAPQPGKDMILNSRSLYKIASALNVNWSPATSREQLVIRREASIVTQEIVTKTLEERLVKDGVSGKFSITYTTPPTDIVLPGGIEEQVEVSALNLDVQRDTFNAVIVSPSVQNPLRRINVSGRIERLIPVPVLSNSLRNGDLIGARDIDWIDVPQNRIANGTVTDERDLINMTPRRPILAGKPIISNELERPKLVDRGDEITLIFANGPMVLTTKGKSMQAGSAGETVRVSNTGSNKNLQGIVTNYREVTIQ
jgi:flagella basal body P-ring formation protein FlgA